jgi:hypothetical protein
LVILIDSGSTHNFIDEQAIRNVKAIIIKTTILAIMITNENIMLCDSHTHGLKWFVQDYEF